MPFGELFVDRSIDAVRHGWTEGLTLTRTMTTMSTPIIAMVEGWAVAGVFFLAMACDLVYAAETATFWPNFLKLGFPPKLGTLLFAPSMVGPYKAKEIFLTGRKIRQPTQERWAWCARCSPRRPCSRRSTLWPRTSPDAQQLRYR